MRTDSNPDEVRQLVDQAGAGDRAAWSHLIDRYHPRLRRLVAMRLDHRLRARIDPSDVLQEAYFDAANQLKDYLRNPVLPFYLWLRMVTGGRLGKTHRHHLATQMRDAELEIPLHGGSPGISSHCLAELILAREHPPDDRLAQEERAGQLRTALDELSAADRELIVLRHEERLNLDEIAQVLTVSRAAAGKRYLRAMARLKSALKSVPGAEWAE